MQKDGAAKPSLVSDGIEKLERNPGPDVAEQENDIKWAAGTLYLGEYSHSGYFRCLW